MEPPWRVFVSMCVSDCVCVPSLSRSLSKSDCAFVYLCVRVYVVHAGAHSTVNVCTHGIVLNDVCIFHIIKSWVIIGA